MYKINLKYNCLTECQNTNLQLSSGHIILSNAFRQINHKRFNYHCNLEEKWYCLKCLLVITMCMQPINQECFLFQNRPKHSLHLWSSIFIKFDRNCKKVDFSPIPNILSSLPLYVGASYTMCISSNWACWLEYYNCSGVHSCMRGCLCLYDIISLQSWS